MCILLFLSACPCACLPVGLFVCLSVCLLVRQSICLTDRLSVCLSVCLFGYQSRQHKHHGVHHHTDIMPLDDSCFFLQAFAIWDLIDNTVCRSAPGPPTAWATTASTATGTFWTHACHSPLALHQYETDGSAALVSSCIRFHNLCIPCSQHRQQQPQQQGYCRVVLLMHPCHSPMARQH